MLPHCFKKTRLSQLLTAGVIAGLGSSAFAGDFVLQNNQITWTNGPTTSATTATVAETGIAESISLLRGNDASSLPNVSFTLQDLAGTTGTYYIRLFMEVKSQSGNNQVEMRLGVVEVAVNDGTITDVDMITNQADPNYAPVKVYARKESGGSTLNLDAEFVTIAGMVTGSGNQVTVNVNNVVNALSGNNNLFDDIIQRFARTGDFDYVIGVKDDSPNGGEIGTNDDGNFVVSPVAAPAFDLNAGFGAEFAGATYIKGTLNIVDTLPSQPDNGGGTTDPDEEDEVTIPESDITDLDNETEQTDQQVDQELESGTVSEDTVSDTEDVTNDAANQTDQLVTGSQTGQVSTSNVLNVLSTSSKTAVTGSKVVNANTTADKTTVTETTKKVISNSATLLDTIATSNEGSDAALTDDQKTQVVNTIVNMATAAKNVTSGSTGKETTAKEMKQNLEKAFQATTRLKVPLTDEAETAIKEAAVSIQVAALAELTGKSTEEVTQEDLQAAFNDPETREKVLAASPKLPLKNPRSNADIEAEINSYITENYPAKSTAVAKDATKQTQDNSDDSPSDNYDDEEGYPDPGCPTLGLFSPGACPGFFIQEPAESSSGVQFLAATEPTQTNSAVFQPSGMTYDKATATTSMPVGDGIMKFSQLGQKAVPAGLTAGIVTQPDGRLTLVGSQGVAMDLAPTAEDTIAMAIALDDMGFPMTFRNDGSFELALASNDKFTGTYGFDTLPAGDRAACGDMTFAPTASIEVNQPDYVFTAECENGITQNIAPFVAEAGMYESLANGGFTLITNRNTGVISVEGVGDFKPSFFSSTPTEAEIAYQAQNSDDLGFAYMPMDVNGDGRIDFKIITDTRVQIMYAVP